MTAFVLNTNALDLLGLKSHIDGLYINDAVVSFTVKDKGGTPVTGTSWPQPMTYISASSGDYRGILPSTVALIAKQKYTAFIEASGGGERIGHWQYPFTPLIRTGLPDDEAKLN